MRPLVAIVLAGIVGGAGGFLFALASLRPQPFPITVSAPFPITVSAPFVVAAASIAGGVLAAWFLTFAILSWAPGQFRCPRCATANSRGVHFCRACLLPFD